MKRPQVEPGQYLVTCDRTGFRVLNTQIRREWTGALVWERVYESRHPQDFLRGIPDRMGVPFARPKTDPVFLDDNEVQRDDL